MQRFALAASCHGVMEFMIHDVPFHCTMCHVNVHVTVTVTVTGSIRSIL